MGLSEIISPELKKRIISAVILAPIVLVALVNGETFYATCVVMIAVIMSFEWSAMIHIKPKEEIRYRAWFAGGIVYITAFTIALLYLRHVDRGLAVVFTLLLCVWATDIAAYFTGRHIGGAKIAPAISPSKTWAGLFGGMLASAIVMATASLFFELGFFSALIFGAFIAVLAQIGDFFESWMKRKFGVKDSGWIIPGHGGVMDRADGLAFVFPVAAIITLMKGGVLL